VLVFLEVDENQHRYGLSSIYAFGSSYACDANRMIAVTDAIRSEETAIASSPETESKQRKILWVRYNPDGFKINGIGQLAKKSDKETLLLQTIEEQAKYLETVDSQKSVTVVYINYDIDENNNLCHFSDPEYPSLLKDISSHVNTTP
jgi:hypothetical protein